MEPGLYTFADVGAEIYPAQRLHDLLEGINSHTYVAETSQRAGDEYFPTYAPMMYRIGRERGWSPMGRSQFEMGRSSRGALLVGSSHSTHPLRYRFLKNLAMGRRT